MTRSAAICASSRTRRTTLSATGRLPHGTSPDATWRPGGWTGSGLPLVSWTRRLGGGLIWGVPVACGCDDRGTSGPSWAAGAVPAGGCGGAVPAPGRGAAAWGPGGAAWGPGGAAWGPGGTGGDRVRGHLGLRVAAAPAGLRRVLADRAPAVHRVDSRAGAGPAVPGHPG